MANGLDSGDSIKGSDTFKFFRGERAAQSPGDRDVPISTLVDYLNDSTVLTNIGGAGGATADELARLTLLEKNLGINFLRDAIAEGWTIFDMVDGFVDEYEDQTGLNIAGSTQAVYNQVYDYVSPTEAGGHSLLIQSDATNSSTTDWSGGTQGANKDTTDSHTITVGGNVKNSTDQFYFADDESSSIRFPGSAGDFLSVPDADASFNFGSGDFTIEMWIRRDATGSAETLSSQENGSTTDFGHLFGINSNDTVRFVLDADGNNSGATTVTSTGTISANTWTHLAAVVDSGTMRIYINGVQDGSGASPGAFNSSSNLTIGGRNGVSQEFTGYMEEVSIINGTCRYPDGTTFSVPVASYLFSATTPNMILLSAAQTASSAPASARMVILHDPVDSVTLNTDAVLSISRDNGTTFTDFELTKEADYGTINGGTVEILTTEDLDISGQPSGTSIIYKLTTANNKDLRLHGAYVQWR